MSEHESDPKIDFELYKFYVELAEKVSIKRASANNYLLTANTFLISFIGFSTHFDAFSKSLWNYLVPAAGVLICLTWYILIRSYSNLNSAKFKVIHEMEERMDYKPFIREWAFAEKGEGKTYIRLSKIERNIPLIFMFLYFVAIVFTNYPT